MAETVSKPHKVVSSENNDSDAKHKDGDIVDDSHQNNHDDDKKTDSSMMLNSSNQSENYAEEACKDAIKASEEKTPCKVSDQSQEQSGQMSKNQMKKLKKREKWLETKHEMRKKERQKAKERLAAKKERGEDIGPTRKKLKGNRMEDSSCKVRVVIDLSLDEYMETRDIKSLTNQLGHCYAANRRAENPLQMYFCVPPGKTSDRIDTIGEVKNWNVYYENEAYDKVFSKESLVYLSSESENVLTKLSEDKVYVIGGLVDHNRHKGICHRLAIEKGIEHAQLPISEYLQMYTRKVLAVNHVFSILLRYTECKDWKQALLSEMPTRKQATEKVEIEKEDDDKEVTDFKDEKLLKS